MFPFSDADTHHDSFPVVNVGLIALNVLILLYSISVGGFEFLFGGGSDTIGAFFLKWGFIPLELTSGETLTREIIPLDVETPIPTWGTIFSSMFMHGGLIHFAGNMAFLWVFGDNVEDRIGHVKYLAFYLMVGVIATLSHWMVDQESAVPLVGASGAVAGVLGAYLLLYPYNRIKVLVIFFFITVVQLPAMVMLGIWFALQLFNAFGSLGLSSQVNVAFFAHIGGFVAGALFMGIFKAAKREPILPQRNASSTNIRYWRGRPVD